MFFYTISIAAAIFIIMIVVSRLLIHFYFCHRVSFRYPGERIKGCHVWTHSDKKGNGKNSEKENAAQHICTEKMDSNKADKTSSGTEQQQQHFTNLFTATPPR